MTKTISLFFIFLIATSCSHFDVCSNGRTPSSAGTCSGLFKSVNSNTLISQAFAPEKNEFVDRLKRKLNYSQLPKLKIDWRFLNNEVRDYFYLSQLKKGGGFLGIGVDQCLTQIVHAKSNISVIYDMDPLVYLYFHSIKALFKITKNTNEFLTFAERLENNQLSDAEMIEFRKLLPDEVELNSEVLNNFFNDSIFHTMLKNMSNRKDPNGNSYTYLGNQSYFNTLKEMFEKNQIVFLSGSHYNPGFISQIQNIFNTTSTKINNYYTTNAFASNWIARSSASHEEWISLAKKSLVSPYENTRQYFHQQIQEGISSINAYYKALQPILSMINQLPFSNQAQMLLSSSTFVNALDPVAQNYKQLSSENYDHSPDGWVYYSLRIKAIPASHNKENSPNYLNYIKEAEELAKQNP